jgi:hypothetical protein
MFVAGRGRQQDIAGKGRRRFRSEHDESLSDAHRRGICDRESVAMTIEPKMIAQGHDICDGKLLNGQ